MFEDEVEVTTKHGIMPSFVACADRDAPVPPVILFMDAPGIREELRNHARRIAREGYYCILPDQYYRLGTLRFDLARRDLAMSSVIGPARASVTDDMVRDDTGGLLSYLDAQDRVRSGPVGMVGHCAGGRHVITAARGFPMRIAGAGVLYPVGVVEEGDESPHRNLAGISAELYVGYGANDSASPPEKRAALRDELERAGIIHEVEVFEDAGHGFQFAERTDGSYSPSAQGSYSPAAAETSWSKLFALWRRRLIEV
jgi:carboxymethylenebutenolidase